MSGIWLGWRWGHGEAGEEGGGAVCHPFLGLGFEGEINILPHGISSSSTIVWSAVRYENVRGVLSSGNAVEGK